MAALKEILSCRNLLNSLSRKYKCNIPAASVLVRKNHLCAVEESNKYDIIIVGGGMIGATLACAIAKNQRLNDKRVLLLERGPKEDYILQPEYSNRVVTLNKLSHTVLSSIGAWKHIQDNRFSKISMMQVWDACSDAVITFNEEKLDEELAYVVETNLLVHAVYKELSKESNTRVIHKAKVQSIMLSDKGEDALVHLADGCTFTGKLLVGADGLQSRVRDAMKGKFVQWVYDQDAVVATLKLSEPTENRVAWQRFLPSGPIALLPLSNEYSSLVWSVSHGQARKLMKMTDEGFVDAVNDALWKVYPKNFIIEKSLRFLHETFHNFSLNDGLPRQLQPSVSKIVKDSRAMFPLGWGHSVYYVRPGAVLVGDAAHRIHPLAGLGVNLGFGDIATLVELLSESVWNGASINDMIYLREYETRRQRHVVPVMVAVDAFRSLYHKTVMPVVLARSIGMEIVNILPTLKNIIKEFASEKNTKFA